MFSRACACPGAVSMAARACAPAIAAGGSVTDEGGGRRRRDSAALFFNLPPQSPALTHPPTRPHPRSHLPPTRPNAQDMAHAGPSSMMAGERRTHSRHRDRERTSGKKDGCGPRARLAPLSFPVNAPGPPILHRRDPSRLPPTTPHAPHTHPTPTIATQKQRRAPPPPPPAAAARPPPPPPARPRAAAGRRPPRAPSPPTPPSPRPRPPPPPPRPRPPWPAGTPRSPPTGTASAPRTSPPGTRRTAR